jgi:hypothetical protein
MGKIFFIGEISWLIICYTIISKTESIAYVSIIKNINKMIKVENLITMAKKILPEYCIHDRQ